MAGGRRYYWLKLKDSFMTSDAVDYMMSQQDGAKYVVLYQMLCLMTINTGGRLSRQIGQVVVPYDVPKIVRDTKWFDAETVSSALELYKAFGLVYEDKDGTLCMADHANLVGSEGDSAKRVRDCRARKAQQAGDSAPGDTGQGDEDESENGPDVPQDSRLDQGLAKIIQSYEENIGSFPRVALDRLQKWRKSLSDDLILKAIEEAALAGVRKWNYIESILKSWQAEGVRTRGDVENRRQRNSSDQSKAGRPRKEAGGSSAKDDYDDIFGGETG